MTYFRKLKGSYTPAVKVTHMTDTGYEPDPDEPDPAEGPKEEGEEEDISDIMTVLAETATGDPDKGSGFIKGIYKLGAEVEKKTRCCYYCKSPEHLVRDCDKFKVAQALLNLKGGADQKGVPPPVKKNTGWPQKKPSATHPTSDASQPSSKQ